MRTTGWALVEGIDDRAAFGPLDDRCGTGTPVALGGFLKRRLTAVLRHRLRPLRRGRLFGD